jgi:hypothetical protein
VNWRQAVLRAAMCEGTLPSLRSLLAGSDFHGVRQKLSYAHARCFCLYLQRRGLLAQCCRALHDRPSGSPETACEVISRLAGQPWSQIEDDFRTFAASLYGVVLPPTSQAAGRGRRPDR